MIAIGLGKQRGADTSTARGSRRFAELIPTVAPIQPAQAPIPFGLALVENGYARLARIEAVPAASHGRSGAEAAGRGGAPSSRGCPRALDVLVIDRIGKDISGLGMDSNVVGRYYTGPTGRRRSSSGSSSAT